MEAVKVKARDEEPNVETHGSESDDVSDGRDLILNRGKAKSASS